MNTKNQTLAGSAIVEQIVKVEIETGAPSIDLLNCANHLRIAQPHHRETAAYLAKSYGFRWHVGGRHVAILDESGKRLALVTGQTNHANFTDWN